MTKLTYVHDRTVEPPGWHAAWVLHVKKGQSLWECTQYGEQLFGAGSTKAEAIAAAWDKVDNIDLYALGARMAVEQLGEGRDHGHGFALVMGTRTDPIEPGEPRGWDVFIVTTFGANFAAMTQMVQYHGEMCADLGLGEHLPDCDMCEALCRVYYENCEIDGPWGGVSTPIAFLEIVDMDGLPAVRIL